MSQFNLFEYEQEAPLFGRLSDWFERCILGLTLVRDELGHRKPLLPRLIRRARLLLTPASRHQ